MFVRCQVYKFKRVAPYLSLLKVRFLKVRGVRAAITETQIEIIQRTDLKTYGVSFLA